MGRSSISKQRFYYSHSRFQKSLDPRLFWVVLLLISTTGMGLVYFERIPMAKQSSGSSPNVPPKVSLWPLKQDILQSCQRLSMPTNWFQGFQQIGQEPVASSQPVQIVVRVPGNFPLDLFTLEVFRALQRNQLQILNCRENLKTKNTMLSFGLMNQVLGRFSFREDDDLSWVDAYVVIIVDDFGYRDDKTVQGFLDLPYPICFSIIPGLKYSQVVARKAIERGFEVMIHLPMEALHSKVERNGYTVRVDMSEKQIRQVVNRACSQLPAAKGLNNHMGSKVSIDRLTLTRLLKALREKGLYFVDSMTSRRSLGVPVARSLGVPAVRMNTYLDNPKSSLGAKEKLAIVIRKAAERGYAIAIAHARSETLKILQVEMPRWAEQGIHFISMSQYWKYQNLKKSRGQVFSRARF